MTLNSTDEEIYPLGPGLVLSSQVKKTNKQTNKQRKRQTTNKKKNLSPAQNGTQPLEIGFVLLQSGNSVLFLLAKYSQ